jgi:hypothetical protein
VAQHKSRQSLVDGERHDVNEGRLIQAVKLEPVIMPNQHVCLLRRVETTKHYPATETVFRRQRISVAPVSSLKKADRLSYWTEQCRIHWNRVTSTG